MLVHVNSFQEVLSPVQIVEDGFWKKVADVARAK
ncbi:hypothetical protein Tco_0667650, partial [Tanacetum coccineum]